MSKQAEKPRTIDVSSHPDVVAAQTKLNELQHARLGVIAEINAAEAERAGRDGGRDAESGLSAGVAELLNGDTEGGLATATRPVPTVEAIQSLFKKRRLLDEAIAVQGKRLKERKARVSREIATMMRPEYEAIVKNMASALEALSVVAEQERAFRNMLEDAGVDFAGVIPPAPIEWARLSAYASRANLWFDQAAEYGVSSKVERRRTP